MTDTAIPPCGPERDRLVAQAMGWGWCGNGEDGWCYTSAMRKVLRPSTCDADALAALEAWRLGNGICSYAVASPDPDDPGFRVCMWYSTDGKSVAGCEGTAPTLRDAATAALVRWRNERSNA